tara:strand:+ start:1705 stop:1866 length:162 start_codon:yes stop_codon:yes gene_type:complete
MKTILLASILIACGDKDDDTAAEQAEVVDTAEQSSEDTGAESEEEEAEAGSEE